MLLSLFADFKLPNARDLEILQEMDPHRVVLGLNDELDNVGKLRWSGAYPLSAEDRLINATEELRHQGRHVTWMIWMRPDIGFSQRIFDTLIKAFDKGGEPNDLLFDVEGFWIKRGITQAQYDKISDEIYEKHWSQLHLPLGLTSYGFAPKQVKYLVEHCDYVVPQAYAVWNNKAYTQEPQVAPGAMQNRSYNTWSEFDKEIIMGLPVYQLARPKTSYSEKMTAEESFTLQVNTARALGVKEVALWSLKHLVGESARSAKFRNFVKETIRGTV